jgi:hypothetical protein
MSVTTMLILPDLGMPARCLVHHCTCRRTCARSAAARCRAARGGACARGGAATRRCVCCLRT